MLRREIESGIRNEDIVGPVGLFNFCLAKFGFGQAEISRNRVTFVTLPVLYRSHLTPDEVSI